MTSDDSAYSLVNPERKNAVIESIHVRLGGYEVAGQHARDYPNCATRMHLAGDAPARACQENRKAVPAVSSGKIVWVYAAGICEP